MGRAELLELNELRLLLEEHQPILEDREKGLKSEINSKIPELEHALAGIIYSYSNAKKSLTEVIKLFGANFVEKVVPVQSIGVRSREGELKLVSETPDYSVTMTDVEVDWMVGEFRELLENIANVGRNQKIMRELMDELNEVRRKNNAIKHALIPQINEQIREIVDKIEQEEIDSLVQLKFFEFG